MNGDADNVEEGEHGAEKRAYPDGLGTSPIKRHADKKQIEHQKRQFGRQPELVEQSEVDHEGHGGAAEQKAGINDMRRYQYQLMLQPARLDHHQVGTQQEACEADQRTGHVYGFDGQIHRGWGSGCGPGCWTKALAAVKARGAYWKR